MKTIRMLVLLVFTVLVLDVGVCPVAAKAPTTPKILFASARDGNRDVYIMNPDGTEQVNLTKHRADDQQAVWSPTGEKILFVSDRGGTRDLYMMNPDGSHVRRFFKFKIEEWRTDPTWSPDGTQFVYERINWDKIEISLHIATLGEQDAEPLVDASFPAWSPDGTEIACSVGERLTLINVRTGAEKQLLPKNVESFQRDPSWSATGDKLAFTWNTHKPPVGADRDAWRVWKDKMTIYIVNRDGTGLRQLIEEDGPYAQYPALSPDGEDVLYTREINGRFQIFKLNLNSGVRTQLTHSRGLLQANAGGDWFDPAYALPVAPQPHLLTTTWGEVKNQK